MLNYSLTDPSFLSDTEIISRVKNKEPQALEELYDRHAARLYGLALKMLNDTARAEKSLHATFVSIWERASHYDPRHGSVLNWLVLVCRECCLANQPFENGRTARSGIGSTGSSVKPKMTNEARRGAEVRDSEISGRVMKALQDLPDAQRRPIELAFFKGMTQCEIAQALNQPLEAVKNRICIGMKTLLSGLKIKLQVF